MRTVHAELPYVDEHAVEIAAPRDVVWVAVQRYATTSLQIDLSSAEDGGTQLRAQTYAAFSDGLGRVYRALVIGSRAHVIAVIRMLRAIRRLSVDPASAADSSAS